MQPSAATLTVHLPVFEMNLQAMVDLPAELFANPVWSALQTKHRHFALGFGHACRYPADVAPFVATAEPSESALQDVCTMLAPDELVYLIGAHYPHFQKLSLDEPFGVLQMALPAEITPPHHSANRSAPEQYAEANDIIELTARDAEEMVALTTLAFPGYFRRRTCKMGKYFGVRVGGELIAMAGERLMHDSYAEISGVCTHPAHRGKGLAARLMWRLVQDHRDAGITSWLHVGSKNQRAIDLYLRMGFQKVREVVLHPARLKA